MSGDNYIRFEPNVVQVDHLGVNISEETLDTLNLEATQYLIVGEHLVSSSSNVNKSYSLIVDHEGVAIKSSIPDRQNQTREYALYVEGDVFVNGLIQTATGTIGVGNVGIGSVSGVANNNYWQLVTNATKTLFYSGRAVLGSAISDAANNTNSLKIIESADRNINHAQINIQNTQNSVFNLAILGTSRESPAVINTTSRTPIEFHVNRTNTYFSQTYGTAQVPSYARSGSNAPHLCIDVSGNVGIRTNCNVDISYTYIDKNAITRQVKAPAQLHVSGLFFASNIVMYDPQADAVQNIDNIYVRRQNIWMEACNVNSGTFPGIYQFASNVAINSREYHPEELYVNGHAKITNGLTVGGFSRFDSVEADSLVVNYGAAFSNDVYVERDLIVNESLKIQGHIQQLFYNAVTGSNEWRQIEFGSNSLQSGLPSGLNIHASGDVLYTPYKFGVGMNDTTDQVENSFVVRKRVNKIYQLELSDKSTNRIERFAAIGHFQPDDVRASVDGSLIITTGNQFDERFNNNNVKNIRQNIYFYPGDYVDVDKTVKPLIRTGNAPTLGIFTKQTVNNAIVPGRVGIHTFEPRAELDVRGNIAVDGQFLFTDENGNLRPIGKWLLRTTSEPNTGSPEIYTTGLYYLDASAPHVGINIPPERNYGLSVEGGIKSHGGYFTDTDDEIVPWLKPTQNYEVPAQQTSMYTLARVGMGVTNTTYPLEVATSYNQPVFVAIHARGGQNHHGVMLLDTVRSWALQANRNEQSVELTSVGVNLGSNDIALSCRVNQTTMKHQVFVACDSNIIRSTDYDTNAALTVGGNLYVLGSVNAKGGYRFNGQVMINAAIENDYPEISDNDVFIGGNIVHVRPNSTSYMSVGYTDQFIRSVYNSTTAPLRVYQSVANRPSIARFISKGTTGYIEVMNEFNKGVRIGVVNNTVRLVDIETSDSYLTFAIDPSNSFNRFIGVNMRNTVTPSANIHVISDSAGNNMMRLVRRGTTDTSTMVASINLEKQIGAFEGDPNTQYARWALLGPSSTYEQKLALHYSESASLLSTTEKFCFTKNGSIGILRTTPEFAIDVACSGKHGSLRFYSQCNLWDTPQIIFQNGSTVFGQDVQNDYRFYSASNEFVIEQQRLTDTDPVRLLSFSSNGQVGIRHTFTQAEAENSRQYECVIGGQLNVTQAIFLNGRRLFSTEDESSVVGFYLRGDDIILNPRREVDNGITYWGGLHVNYTESTSNLVFIAGQHSANMMVMDSRTSKVQMHMMQSDTNTTGSIYRIETDQKTFRIALRQNYNVTEKYISDSADGYMPAYEVSPYTTDEERFRMTVFGDLALSKADSRVSLSSDLSMRASNEGLVIVQDNTGNSNADLPLFMLSNASYPANRTVVTRDNRVRIGDMTIPSGLASYQLSVANGIACYGGNVVSGTATGNLGLANYRWNDVFLAGKINMSTTGQNTSPVSLFGVQSDIHFKNIDSASTIESFAKLHASAIVFDDATSSNINATSSNITYSTDFIYRMQPHPEYKLLIQEVHRNTNVTNNFAPLWRNLSGNFYNFGVPLSVGDENTEPASTFYVYNSSNIIPTVHFESSTRSIFFIDENDNIGIGTTAPTVPYENNVTFKFNQTGTFEQDVNFLQNVDIALDCVVHGDITNDSDLRIKKDLQKIDHALDKVARLTGYTFTRIQDNVRSTGLVAQEILPVLPEVVRQDADGMYSVAYANMMGLIVEAIKDLKAEITELKEFVGYRK